MGLYLSVAFLVNDVWLVAVLPLVLIVLHVGVIRREERYLEAKFGNEYREYKAKVRRWLWSYWLRDDEQPGTHPKCFRP